MGRFLKFGSLVVLVAGLVSYLGDAIVLQIRLRHSAAYRVIQVDQFLKTPLKGQKDEYDLAGQIDVTCARSIYPQLGMSPCWWVERHQTQWN